MRWLLILFALPLAAQITCSPSNCVATAGGTVTLTSGTSVAWSLGSGSVGSLSTVGPSTSTVFTAPTGVVPGNQMGGCQTQPNDSIFNARVDGLSADSNSTAMIAAMYWPGTNFFPLNFQPSWGISTANSATPTTTFKTYYGNNIYSGIPQPTNQYLFRESGNMHGIFGYYAAANNGASPDHHQMIVRSSDCGFWDTYNNYLAGAVSTCQDGTTPGCNVTSVGILSGLSYAAMTGGTDAASLPLAALTLHADELRRGVLSHMVRFTTCGSCFVGYNQNTASSVWMFPAQSSVGGCAYPAFGDPCPLPTYDGNGVSSNYIFQGSILRLKSGFSTVGRCNSDTGSTSGTCSIAGICASPLTSTQQTICSNLLTGLQQHGMINADTGSRNAITPALDVTADADVMAALNAVHGAGISITNFEVVDTVGSGIIQAPTTYQVTPQGSAGYSGVYGNITYGGATQSALTPGGQAVVVGGSNSKAVVIQTVTVGSTLPPDLGFVQAGSYSIPLASYMFVNPSSVSQSLTLSIVGGSSCGTASGTTYTPPSTGSSVVTGCAWHFVSVADSAATLDIQFTLFPTGDIHVDTGSSATTTDGLGKTWQADPGVIGANNVQSGTVGAWGGNYATQFNTQQYSQGADFTYAGFMNPVHNYQLHVLAGQAYGAVGTWVTPSGSGRNFSTVAWNPINVELNGTIEAHAWNWPWLNGYLYNNAAGADIYVPGDGDAQGYVTFSVRPLAPEVNYSGSGFNVTTSYTGPNLAPTFGQKWNLLSGFELLQDSASPFLSIDMNAGGQPSGCTIIPTGLACAAGTALQPLYVVNHYISGFVPTSTTWSVLSNSSGITASITTNADGSGSLTLGSGTPLAGQPIVVQATNGSKTATATIQTSGSRWLLNAK